MLYGFGAAVIKDAAGQVAQKLQRALVKVRTALFQDASLCLRTATIESPYQRVCRAPIISSQM